MVIDRGSFWKILIKFFCLFLSFKCFSCLRLSLLSNHSVPVTPLWQILSLFARIKKDMKAMLHLSSPLFSLFEHWSSKIEFSFLIFIFLFQQVTILWILRGHMWNVHSNSAPVRLFCFLSNILTLWHCFWKLIENVFPIEEILCYTYRWEIKIWSIGCLLYFYSTCAVWQFPQLSIIGLEF